MLLRLVLGGGPIILALILRRLFARPELLIVGSVTVDLLDHGTSSRPGGAVAYAAVAARALGVRAHVLTAAGPGADLGALEGHNVHLVPAPSTLTFDHAYDAAGARQLHVVQDTGVTLHASQLPWRCRRARVVLLGPLTAHDVDAASFQGRGGWLQWLDALLFGPQHVGIAAQGFQRALGPGGLVLPLPGPAPQLLAGNGQHTSVFLSDVEVQAWGADDLAAVAGAHARLVVTLGRNGAEEWSDGGVTKIPRVEVDVVVDTNGAGDTFATGYMVGLLQGHPDPAYTASWAASRAVTVPQACKPECIAGAIAAEWTASGSSQLRGGAGVGLCAARGPARGLRRAVCAAVGWLRRRWHARKR